MTSAIRRVSASEAAGLLQSGYVIVDVRTELEWAMGHPPGAANIPWQLEGPTGLVPNGEFLSVMQALYSHDSRLMTFCLQGKRSLAAAEALTGAGYAQVVDVRPGWGGLRNPFGGLVEPGWQACGLPSEIASAGASYAELRARAGSR